jgi:hypothetical protein
MEEKAHNKKAEELYLKRVDELAFVDVGKPKDGVH